MSEPSAWSAANLAHWDERAPLHAASRFYDLDGFVAGGSTLRAFELEEVGDVAGRTLVHLQCHLGLDTLSWARRGAAVTGLDFSAPAIEAARALAARTGLDATFVHADVMDAEAALVGRFDVVYTGVGAINWLRDLDGWARVVASLLTPGGSFYMAEFHPFASVLDDELSATLPYFHDQPLMVEEAGSYADADAPTTHNRVYEWTHGLGAVVSALIGAGLRIELLHEHDFTLYPRWPFLEVGPRGYEMPAGRPALPLMYSLRAAATR